MRKEYEAPEMLISVLDIQNITNSDDFNFGEGEEDVWWDDAWSSLLQGQN